MKRTISILSLVLFTIALNAQNTSNDSVSTNQHDLESLKKTQIDLMSQIETLESRIGVLETKFASVNKQCSSNEAKISDLTTQIAVIGEQVGINTSTISANAESLGAQINLNTESVNYNANKIHVSLVWGSVVVALVFVISVLLSLLLRKKGRDEIMDLKEHADNLNQKIVEKLSNEVNDLQEIARVLSNNEGGSKDEDHSLVKALADRISFMEVTLYRMDSSVRGHHHLSRTIAQMKDNLVAYGYEIVEMLGKPYNDGMRVTANFIEDSSLEPGQQIITGIIKPQINYNGIMIQSAQITVSQNI